MSANVCGHIKGRRSMPRLRSATVWSLSEVEGRFAPLAMTKITHIFLDSPILPSIPHPYIFSISFSLLSVSF